MRPFRELTARGQILRMRRAAERALSAWGLAGARLVFLSLVENATFRVEADGRFLLRLHLLPFKGAAEIRSEFAWLEALRADTDLTVPRPVPTLAGDTVATVDTESDPPVVLALLLEWVPGRICWRSARARHFRGVGVVMARLHEHAESWTRPDGFARYDWRGRGLFCVGNDFVLEPAETWSMVPKQHRGLFRDVEARTASAMEEMDRRPNSSGLLHSDLHPGNLVFEAGEPRPIDFDDCGIGHWIYDLAIPAAWGYKPEKHAARLEALLGGYESVRPFPGDQLRHLDLFMAARMVSNALWLADHSRDYADHRENLSKWIGVTAKRVRELEVV